MTGDGNGVKSQHQGGDSRGAAGLAKISNNLRHRDGDHKTVMGTGSGDGMNMTSRRDDGKRDK